MENKTFPEILESARQRQTETAASREQDIAIYTEQDYAEMGRKAEAFNPEGASPQARFSQLCRVIPLLHRAAPYLNSYGTDAGEPEEENGHVWFDTGFTARIGQEDGYEYWNMLCAAADTVYFTWKPRGMRVTFTVFGARA